MPAADGKKYLTDAATAETLLRLVQSVPSPKAEPIKLWLAKVGYERMQEMADPARSLTRVRETWQKQGRSAKWIRHLMMPQFRCPSFPPSCNAARVFQDARQLTSYPHVSYLP